MNNEELTMKREKRTKKNEKRRGRLA